MKYLTKTKSDFFKIRIRVSKELKPFFNKLEINKSLHTKDYRKAVAKSKSIINEYLLIDESFKIGVYSEEITNQVVENFLTKIGQKKEETSTSSKVSNTHKRCFEEFKRYYMTLDINNDKRNTLLSFLSNVFLVLINPDSLVTSSDFNKMLQLEEQLKGLPKRNIQKYKKIPIKDLLSLDIDKSERISARTLHEYFGYIKRFYNYCKAQRYMEVNPTDFITIKRESPQDVEREAFSRKEMNKILNLIDLEDENMNIIYYSLIYTGLRSSELWKAKLKQDKTSGIWFFDLTSENIKLKTLSSYRVVPLHKALIDMKIHKLLPKALMEFNQDYIQRWFNHKIKPKVTNSKKKVLYSFRHTVATELKYKGVTPIVISEILGHSHKGMTLGRYASRFPIEVLKKAIDKLEF